MQVNRRRSDLLAHDVDGGVVIYDPRTETAHNLNPVAAAVFAACDGTSDATDIAGRIGAPVADVHAAVTWLDGAGLLERPVAGGLSRRRVLAGAGALAGAAVATGLATTIALPAAQAAASTIPSQPPGCPHLSAWCWAVWFTTPCYWWRCDETSTGAGKPCIDYSGNRRNGAYAGTCATTPGAVGCDQDPGVVCSGTGSDPSTGQGRLTFSWPSGSLARPSSIWTMGAFFSPSATCTAAKGIALLSCGATNTVDLSIEVVNGRPAWVVTTAASGKVGKIASAPLGTAGKRLLTSTGAGAGTWHFVTLAFTPGATFQVCVDGQLDATLSMPKAALSDGGDNKSHLWAANAATKLAYAGGIDEVIAWAASLPPSTIAVLYAAAGNH